jgi:Icc-related predicted phosphoesterase
LASGLAVQEDCRVRLFFATDVHGSEVCWRKFLNTASHFRADTLVLGGDMTGKGLVAIVDVGEGVWRTELFDQTRVLRGEAEVAEFEQVVRRRGYYTFRTRPDELAELRASPSRLEALFREQMTQTLARWMRLADRRLAATGVTCVVCPGNDDVLELDEVIRAARRVRLGEGDAVWAGEYQVASVGWTNRTPWDTYREEDEEQLASRIERTLARLEVPPERAVLNFHCPPYGSGLDLASVLDEKMTLVHAGRITAPVGSTAVRAAIERHQPILSLHGHVHEARGFTRIGRTLAINPGSSYGHGDLLGAIVDLSASRRPRFLLIDG